MPTLDQLDEVMGRVVKDIKEEYPNKPFASQLEQAYLALPPEERANFKPMHL